MITAFDLVQSSRIEAMIDLVNAKIRDGWEPFESVYVSCYESSGSMFYTQGMVKRDTNLCPVCNSSIPGVIAFNLIQTSTPESMVARINEHIANGWQPFEDIYVVVWEDSNAIFYIQGMVQRQQVCMNCGELMSGTEVS